MSKPTVFVRQATGLVAAIPASTALYGGTTAYSFGYDDLYQLTSATGAFAKPNVPTQQFTLGMAYDGIHNITHKTQTSFNVWSTGAKTPNLPLTYDWTYAYAGGRPHAASQIGNHAFKYDLDGNQAGWNATDSGQNRVMVWDEDNRLQQVTDSSGQPTTFKYDDGTNRVVKKGAGGETLYINPWYVAALGRNSKQIFAGATRIATKLEQFPSGEGYGTGAKNLTSFYQYFYHPDHLGSTGFVTDATGEVYQHLEYFPFGETWVDEVSDDTRVPYRFTGQGVRRRDQAVLLRGKVLRSADVRVAESGSCFDKIPGVQPTASKHSSPDKSLAKLNLWRWHGRCA